MKTITIVLVVLFAIVSIFFSIALIKNNSKGAGTDGTLETVVAIDTTETAGPAETIPVETTSETAEVTYDEADEMVREIELYLDGDNENGIFLGNAEYGLPSEEVAMLYGQDFSNFGFYLKFDTEGRIFEPGSIHSIYIYTFIPSFGWESTRTEIMVPGNQNLSETIRMSIDSLGENELIKADQKNAVRVSGWAADLGISDSPGINKIEIYLDGPRNFGKKLGDAQLGLARTDVGNAYGNANYNSSGYNFSFDATGLEQGSTHKVYIYAYSNAGDFQYLTRDIVMEGDAHQNNAIAAGEVTFNADNIEVSGWATNKAFITQGVPRSLDLEYSIKKIVFVSSQSGNEDIWSMNLDGSELTRLTDNPGRDMYPTISPDGKKIAYSADIGGFWQIVIMNWDGSNKKQITTGPYNHGYPSWSFDGRYIFIELFIDENWEIFVMDSSGSNLRRLTNNPGIYDWHPAAHPFEYKILYEAGFSGNEEIWQIDINGENNKKISVSGRNYRVPKYSIDGKKIAFMSLDNNNREQIFVMDVNGENIIQLTDSPNGARLPCFSPDNKNIVYSSALNGAQIFIMDTNGSNKKQLTNNPGEDWGAVFMYQLAD